MPGRENGFKLFTGGKLPYLQSPALSDNTLIDHAFSTRKGGCSEGPFKSLNTGYHTGDKWECVVENRNRFMRIFDYDYRFLTSSVQVHGTEIGVFDKANRGEGALPETARRQCDALVTEEPGLPLAAYSADCQLIYFAAFRKKPVIALVHAGWRGTLGNIGGKTVNFFKHHYAVEPEILTAVLSPAICRRCYLVDQELSSKFQAAGWFDSAYLAPAAGEGFELDLAAVNTTQLIQSGIKKENIARTSWCTSCSTDLFYSYRRDQGLTGRMLGFIAIKGS
ncbi:MAG: peptidoglycan editing factor PgeF [Bacillota bacterium]